jgi:hypothetical protein
VPTLLPVSGAFLPGLGRAWKVTPLAWVAMSQGFADGSALCHHSRLRFRHSLQIEAKDEPPSTFGNDERHSGRAQPQGPHFLLLGGGAGGNAPPRCALGAAPGGHRPPSEATAALRGLTCAVGRISRVRRPLGAVPVRGGGPLPQAMGAWGVGTPEASSLSLRFGGGVPRPRGSCRTEGSPGTREAHCHSATSRRAPRGSPALPPAGRD